MSRPESVKTRVGYLLKQAQHALRINMDMKLRPLNLSTGRYALLASIQEVPHASGAELARRCFITPQSVNGLMKGLQKRGLIERTPSKTHGRVIGTTLTEQGSKRLKQAHAVVIEVERKMLRGLDVEQRSQLAENLMACVKNLEAGCE